LGGTADTTGTTIATVTPSAALGVDGRTAANYWGGTATVAAISA
jgi:hypothetical protein